MIYVSLQEDRVHFSFDDIFNNNYFVISTSESLQAYMFASLNLKKEVFIFKNNQLEVSFSKGRHFHFDEQYIYLNPSIRKKLSSLDGFSFGLDFLTLSNYLKTSL